MSDCDMNDNYTVPLSLSLFCLGFGLKN
uniref:Uncharacterized protein n=1 Tax=Rhizophora mucronata TaxID=61149 RepID=A0A2P2MJH1_RHIMU